MARLNNHPYAQCEIINHDDGTIDFISYTTLVIRVDPNGWLECTGLYSATTRKQIGWFMHEVFNLDYHWVRDAYNRGYRLNVHTGEVEDL